MHKHLRRLDRLWLQHPVYFITSCTYRRRDMLTRPAVAEILINEWRSAHARHGWAIGRYVIMPDHVHFFCRPELDAKPLPEFIGSWKRWTSRRVHALDQPGTASPATTSRSASTATPSGMPLWQREFFDHVMRSSESYSEKWNYVRENPVRAGLIENAGAWPFSGEIETLML